MGHFATSAPSATARYCGNLIAELPSGRAEFPLIAKRCEHAVGGQNLPSQSSRCIFLQELIAWLRANPDKASLGTPGVGQQPHLAGVLFQNLTGTRFQHVPYRGAGPAIQDLVAGQIDLVFGDPSVVPYVRAGSVKAITVPAKHRLPAVPDVPTAEESGLAGFVFANWVGIFAPRGTPKDIVGKLNSAVMSTLADPEIRSRLVDLGVEIPSREQQTPEGFAAFQKADIEKWWPIIKAAGINGE
jgi:tripartite-type tricarboxylate transporter receptor subunit TctC